MLVKAEAAAQGQWDVAVAWARHYFESCWKSHLREKEASSLDEDLRFEPSTMLAICEWLEELGPHLIASCERYADVTASDSTYILCKQQAFRVEEALGRAHNKLEKVMKVVDFNTLTVLANTEQAEVPDDLNFKLNLCEAIAGSKIAVVRALEDLKRWESAWKAQDSWQKNMQTRKDAFSKLRDASKVIRIAAEAIEFSPEFAGDKIDRIAKGYFKAHGELAPAYPRKRKERDTGTSKQQELAAFKMSGSWSMPALTAYRERFRKGMRCYYYALEGMQSADKKELDKVEVGEMQDELEVGFRALQKVASKLQFRLQDEMEEKLNLKIVALQKDMDVLKATVAADKKKIEEDKAQLEASQLKFNKERAHVKASGRSEALACQKCRQRPHNVVIIPCLHAKYCSECLQTHRKTSTACPICSGAITGTVQYLV